MAPSHSGLSENLGAVGGGSPGCPYRLLMLTPSPHGIEQPRQYRVSVASGTVTVELGRRRQKQLDVAGPLLDRSTMAATKAHVMPEEGRRGMREETRNLHSVRSTRDDNEESQAQGSRVSSRPAAKANFPNDT